ncbi:MAG: YbjN domain-containing protein [Akkermansiaceae bacterium]|nr:YbjN domain-containing protein [Akkermansiaceae bacterium]
MSQELITADNLTKELLASILDAAFMEYSLDDENDLMVNAEVNYFVLLSDRKDRIQLMCLFGFEPDSSELERLQCVNNINNKYIIIRASSRDNKTLCITWDIPVAGGISKKAFVLALKRFSSIPQDAIKDFASDLIK